MNPLMERIKKLEAEIKSLKEKILRLEELKMKGSDYDNIIDGLKKKIEKQKEEIIESEMEIQNWQKEANEFEIENYEDLGRFLREKQEKEEAQAEIIEDWSCMVKYFCEDCPLNGRLECHTCSLREIKDYLIAKLS